MRKQKLVISFSGGETSAYMAWYCKKHLQDQYDMVFIFANTGQENEETLQFVQQCDDHFELNVVWVEAKINPKTGGGTRHTVVNYKTASRDGKPFEDGIKKFAIPNLNNNWCTRDLKLYPIQSYIKHVLKWDDYHTAIGIRHDEIDRINKNHRKNKLIYPLIQHVQMNKQKINFWWNHQPFRLKLKGYEGNCKWCWKKSDNKLMTIAKLKPHYFDFPKRMECDHENYRPSTKEHSMQLPVRFFRQHKSVKDIFDNSKKDFTISQDDSTIYNWQISIFDDDINTSNGCSESCEVY